jgi:sulfopyruvate decarboxylase subunit alpha
MSASDKLLEAVTKAGIDFLATVPCSMFKDFLDKLGTTPGIRHLPVTREEEGIGIAVGAYMAGRTPALVMQNSGYGNVVNAVFSLVNYYQVPLVFLISHRGSAGEWIDAQKEMGRGVYDVVKATDVELVELKSVDDISVMDGKIADARAAHRSVAFLFPFSFWE